MFSFWCDAGCCVGVGSLSRTSAERLSSHLISSHWLSPSSSSSSQFASLSICSISHFVHDLDCKTEKSAPEQTAICDARACVLVSRNQECPELSFHFSYSHYDLTVGHVINSGSPCGITSAPAHASINASFRDFVFGSLSHFKMILRKPRSLTKPERDGMEYAVGPFLSQHVAPVWRQIRI